MQPTSLHGMQATWPLAVATAAAQALHDLAPRLHLLNFTMHLPFDVARWQHARAVQAGLLERSMLESRDFERVIDRLERIALGPFARHV